MNVNDCFQIPMKENIYMFSANGVPYPLDEWLALRGEMTTSMTAELIKRWYPNIKK